jgi:hypothetical protein
VPKRLERRTVIRLEDVEAAASEQVELCQASSLNVRDDIIALGPLQPSYPGRGKPTQSAADACPSPHHARQ